MYQSSNEDGHRRLLIAAGGSGGHLIPAQAFAQAMVKKGYTVHFAGHALSENKFFKRALFSYTDIESLPYGISPKAAIRFLRGFLKGSFQAFSFLKQYRPDMVIGFGSYHTVSMMSATLFRGVPYVLYESNAVPGRVIRLFARGALWTGCAFAEAATTLSSTRLVNVPLREEMYAAAAISRREVLARYGLDEGITTLLVIGGSQGARSLNQQIPPALIELSKKRSLQVLHLAGSDEEAARLKCYYSPIQAVVRAYEPKMMYAYSASDVVISRCGASTLAELELFGRQALLIPYPYAADNHQTKNAMAYLQRRPEMGVMLSETACDKKSVADVLFTMMEKPLLERGYGRGASFADLVHETVEKSRT